MTQTEKNPTLMDAAGMSVGVTPEPDLRLSGPSDLDRMLTGNVAEEMHTGYTIPEYIAVQGIPRGSTWRYVRFHDIPDFECWKLLGDAAPDRFPKWSWNKGRMFGVDNCADILIRDFLDYLPEYVEYFGTANTYFVGKKNAEYPWLVSTDSAPGKTTLTYTVAQTVSDTHTTTDGWSAGGTLSVNLEKGGAKGTAQAQFQYSHATSDQTSWTNSNSVGNTLDIPEGSNGRIDAYAIAGRYDGWLVVSLLHQDGPKDGHWFNKRMWHTAVSWCHIAVPVQNAFVKTPSAASAVWRQPRIWRSGDPAPSATKGHVPNF
ncbi:hypothetical protein [Streptomyces griseocarneus]|uniref:hypothetical protein n=1 Tax=Streptomyces griseocarneus TaxID=51201 RepID=UPI00167E103B|nr:hypothetical protein [Streptomyces griseocarneus]MBZ6476137.1 hypothetical protein [Streptomyces griseocarneus]GHG63797.1 hypothetical protein GCM10018779_33730 [Streptomyces griseocarneus]